MLTAYLNAVTALLQQPPAPAGLYSTALLTTFINSARGQVAGESESIRVMGAMVLSPSSFPAAQNFSSITLGGAAGVQGVINVRNIWWLTGGSRVWLTPEAFEWFSIYELNTTATPGPPVSWSQFGQGATAQGVPGSSGGGSLYIGPGADNTYHLELDCVCFPAALNNDSDPEAIPYLWTDAVPYFAAYSALLSAQTGMRSAQAEGMFKLYEVFMQRARKAGTPSVLPWQFEQTQVPGGINNPPPQRGA